MKTFAEDIKAAADYHGHLCSGQCVGVKIARFGLKTLGLDRDKDRKKLMVFVECNRCPADAIMITTGCRVGKRTFRAMDFGKVAATFVNLETGEAIRVRRKKRCHPADGEDMVTFYENLPDDEMLAFEHVEVDIKPCDLPGKPIEVVNCQLCGEDVTDSRHLTVDGKILCKTCAGQGYYKKREYSGA